jgi:hypothetical protein
MLEHMLPFENPIANLDYKHKHYFDLLWHQVDILHEEVVGEVETHKMLRFEPNHLYKCKFWYLDPKLSLVDNLFDFGHNYLKNFD